MTLVELAKAHGQLMPAVIDGERFSAKHLTAAVRHGWARYEHNYGPLDLSSEDYLAALEAAGLNASHPAADKR